MEEKQVKLEELMKDEAFLDAIFSKESSEEVQKLFAEKGVELTMEEIDGLAAAILQASQEQNGELSVDTLDSVAGGISFRQLSCPLRFLFPIPRPCPCKWPWIRWQNR